MKIAVLILAHKNPVQLRRLVDRMKTDFEVFIHFDKRSLIHMSFPPEEHVHILENKHATYWGSNNIVLAEIDLLRAAHILDSDYYILISGQDLPLLSNAEIKEFVVNNYSDHIEHSKLPIGYWGQSGGIERISLFWENNAGKGMWPYLNKVGGFATRTLQKTFNVRRKLSFDLYGGSQWFNLTKESVRFILSFIDNNEWYLKRFKHTRASDEIFFQTILLAFDYHAKDKIRSHHLRYFDWDTGPEYPRVLRLDDHEKIMKSKSLFARKFDEQMDTRIIDKILNSRH
jgi:hypothetical protein